MDGNPSRILFRDPAHEVSKRPRIIKNDSRQPNKDENKFWFLGEIDVDNQKKIVVSQVDIDQGVITDV